MKEATGSVKLVGFSCRSGRSSGVDLFEDALSHLSGFTNQIHTTFGGSKCTLDGLFTNDCHKDDFDKTFQMGKIIGYDMSGCKNRVSDFF